MMKVYYSCLLVAAVTLLVGCASLPDRTPQPLTATAIVIPADHPSIQIIGRVDDTDPLAPRFSFSGVIIRASFEADAIVLLLDDESLGDDEHTNAYTVVIDGIESSVLVPTRGVTRHLLASDLAPGGHTVEIRKRTEGLVGAARFLGFELADGGRMLVPPPRSDRRIEFVGDSIACGYGSMVASDPPKASFSSINENHDVAFGALTAGMLGAESHTVAFSGRGIHRGFNMSTDGQMPAVYHRTIAEEEEPRWDHARWRPHVIVINLGTNDFAHPGLRDKDFRDAYGELVDRLRAIHPDAVIVCCVGPMLNDGWPVGERPLSRARGIVGGIVETRAAFGDGRIYYHEFEQQRPPYGENWHPSRATHRGMAESLAARLADIMEWGVVPR